MRYFIEHWIETLAHNAVMEEGSTPASFSMSDITFQHNNFNMADGWKENGWIASGYIEAPNFAEAINTFRNKLLKIVPRVALISQSYTEFLSQSFLITKEGSDVGFLRYVERSETVGLMFMEKELEALKLLMARTDIPEEFYFYWNDAVNGYGYTSKVLNVLSAVECLSKKANGEADWNKRVLMLGQDLVYDLWGVSGNRSQGLRHRLTHGEYFQAIDNGKNYLDIIHKKIIVYFNSHVLGKDLLMMDVVSPQRHFFGNMQECRNFIKAKEGFTINLKDVLQDFNGNDIYSIKNYEFEWDRKVDD